MRELADSERIRRFMRALGDAADDETAAYLTGGATAVLLGWRESELYRYPAVDPGSFAARVDEFFGAPAN